MADALPRRRRPRARDLHARFQEQAAALIAALMASEPLAHEEDPDERERTIRMLAEMLAGAMQALASWWLDHPDAPREIVVAHAMDFAWLGLERLSRGERV